MSKKSQTTGLPKANKPASKAAGQPSAPSARQPRLLRETQTKAERDAQIQRILVLVTGAVLGITAIILIGALIFDQLIIPNQAVARVNGETITVSEFERRVRIERFFLSSQINAAINQYRAFGFDDATINQQLFSQPPFSTYINELNIPDQLGNRVINTMVEDELVRQEVARRGITVDQDAVQKQINRFFGYDPEAGLFTPTPTVTPTTSPTPFVSPTPSPTPTETPIPTATPTSEVTPTEAPTEFPTATPTNTPDATQRADEFNRNRTDYYSALRSNASVSDADINAYFETLAMREALRDAITADLPRTTMFVNARHILVGSEEEANQALAALNAGESFAALAAAISTDQSNKDRGGDLGWAPPSNYVEEFAAAVTDAEIGAIVGPVQTQFGWHIIQVRGREEREMNDSDFERAKETRLTEYIQELRDAAGSGIEIFDTWIDYVPR
jgi:hypothetical protein